MGVSVVAIVRSLTPTSLASCFLCIYPHLGSQRFFMCSVPPKRKTLTFVFSWCTIATMVIDVVL